MSSHIKPVSRFHAPRRPAFTFLEVLLVLGIIALFIVCIVGYFVSRGVEPLKPPAHSPAVDKATPAPVAPEPVRAPRATAPAAEPAPAAPAEPAP